MTTLRHAGACALWLALAATADAQVTAHASVNKIQFTVTDLRPDDNIAPGFYWAPDPADGPWSASRLSEGHYNIIWLNADNTIYKAEWMSNFSPVGKPFVKEGGFDTWANTPSARASSSSETVQADLDLQVGGRVSANTFISSNFVLTPHTSLTLTALGEVSAQGAIPAGALRPHGVSYFTVDSYAGIALSDLNDGFTPWQTANDDIAQHLDEQGLGAPLSQSTTRALTATYVNDSDHDLSGAMLVNAYVKTDYLNGILLPVPEPSDAALMLLGLAGMAGLMARRKRQ